MTQSENTPARIVVDWGSSNFRAYRFTSDGVLAEQKQAAAGILTVTDGAFEAALVREIGTWLVPGCEVFLSGMITSRNGWLETPYIEAPADLTALAAGARTTQSEGGITLHFLPGVAVRNPVPDVMRGEEIQVFGSVAADETALVVLPGTHSKWVQVEQGRIVGFRTFLSGEMFALLRTHSIIGRLIPPQGASAAPVNDAAFLAGVEQAMAPTSSGLLNDVFTARSGALLNAFALTDIAERLSGLIIGHELRSGLALAPTAASIRLVGEAALCQRYKLALAHLGVAADLGPAHATVEGFRRLNAL
jgi:2-dehydro-3-deoxygalactonokinase